MLVPLLVVVFFAAVAERGHPAISKVRRDGIIATLLDPLSLFAGRSPGERGEGALLSTKPGHGPEERVLSTVRDRDPAGAAPPAGDPGFLPDSALPGAPPAENALPAGGVPGDQFAPFGAPFSSPGEPGGGFIPGGGSGLVPPLPPDPPLTSGIPEPATWAVMILGFFAVGWAMRRRAQLRPDPAAE
ncbi:MAG: PEPxxWA-CTERM sorting domain-containing protein [Pseudomonadota bacterium]